MLEKKMSEFRDMFNISLSAHISYLGNRIENKRNKEVFLSTMKLIEQTEFYMDKDVNFSWWLNNALLINNTQTDNFTLFSSPNKYRRLAYETSFEILQTIQKRLYGTYNHRQKT
jgi:hypothetical protein